MPKHPIKKEQFEADAHLPLYWSRLIMIFFSFLGMSIIILLIKLDIKDILSAWEKVCIFITGLSAPYGCKAVVSSINKLLGGRD